ncbi:hypothetical protein HKD37_01G000906 [Glycine soja]
MKRDLQRGRRKRWGMVQKRESSIQVENKKNRKRVFVQHNLLGHDSERDSEHNQSATMDTGSEMMAMTTLALETGSESCECGFARLSVDRKGSWVFNLSKNTTSIYLKKPM